MTKTNEFTEDVQSGAGSFIFFDTSGHRHNPIKVWFQKPAIFEADTKLLFIMPGSSRDGKLFRDFAASKLENFEFLLMAPSFSNEFYPEPLYTLGNVFNEEGNQHPEDVWTYSVIENLFKQVKELFNLRTESYSIFGNSAGAQFVHRMLLLKKNPHLRKAIAANPAFYITPTLTIEYPYGFAGTSFTEENLINAFKQDFTLFLGENDNDDTNPFINKSPEAMKQGRHRLERGINFFKTAEAEAARLQTEFNWKLEIIPEADHDYPFILPAAKLI